MKLDIKIGGKTKTFVQNEINFKTMRLALEWQERLDKQVAATLAMIQDNIELAKNHDAVDTVVEAVDTIVESTNGQFITDIPNRAHLYQGQTPQTFRCKDFIDLYGSLSADEKEILTDACKIFVIKGKDVALAKGEYSNLKITTVTDLKIAKSMIEKD